MIALITQLTLIWLLAGRNPLLPELLALFAPEPAASAELACGHASVGEAHGLGSSEVPLQTGVSPAAAAPTANGAGEASEAWPSCNQTTLVATLQQKCNAHMGTSRIPQTYRMTAYPSRLGPFMSARHPSHPRCVHRVGL